MLLRPAQTAELPSLVDLINRAYRGTGPNASWNAETGIASGPRITLDQLQSDLAANPQVYFLTARDTSEDPDTPDGPILGTVWLDPADPATWYLGLLTVDPMQQKLHLGRTLLADAEAFAQTHAATRIRMSVTNVREALIAWYERRGYQLTGETQPFPTDGSAGQPLIPGLHFVIMQKIL